MDSIHLHVAKRKDDPCWLTLFKSGDTCFEFRVTRDRPFAEEADFDTVVATGLKGVESAVRGILKCVEPTT